MTVGLVLLALIAAPPARVVHATRARAYFDRGADEGFVVGARVRAGGRACTVDLASNHHASCAARLREGAAAVLESPVAGRAPPSRPGAGPRVLRPRPLPAVAFVKVAAGRSLAPLAAAPLRATAAVFHGVWAGASSSGTHQRTDVAVTVSRAKLGFLGLEAGASLLASGRPQRPDTVRFRPGTDVALYVFEAGLSSRDPHRSFTLALGRIRPWHAPGLVEIDGLQAGWAHQELEVGAFAGFLPELITLAPSAERWTAGAYWGAVHELGPLRFSHEGRVAALGAPGVSPRGEVEVRARADLPAGVDGGGGVRVGAGGGGGPAILGFSADLGVRPFEIVALRAEYRERRGSSVPDLDGLGDLQDSRHAGGAVEVDVAPWLTARAIGGYAAPLDGEGRAYAGPELSVRASALDVAAGYEEELGAPAGRMAWLQASLRPADGWRISARGAWFDDRASEADAHSISSWLSVRGRLSSFLDAAASALVIVPIAGVNAPPSAAFRIALESSF